MRDVRDPQPLRLTIAPQLDAALGGGWASWSEAAIQEPTERLAAWLHQRTAGFLPEDEARALSEALLRSADTETRAFAAAELAESADDSDTLLAEALWEGVLALGHEADDSDLLFEATTRLAEIAEEQSDPLAAAERWIALLNWRRQGDHGSDPEMVLTAFDEIVRLAEMDGEPEPAARYSYRQARFAAIAETDPERALSGDWETTPDVYTSWA